MEENKIMKHLLKKLYLIGVLLGLSAQLPSNVQAMQVQQLNVPQTSASWTQSLFSSKLAGCFTLGAVAYGGFFAKRFYNFNRIENWLHKSSPILLNERFKDFEFSSWKQHENAYKTATLLLKNHDTIFPLLENNTNKDIHIFDTTGKKMQKPSIDQIKSKINSEINTIRNNLEYVSHYTDFSEIFLKQLETLNQDNLQNLDNSTTQNLINAYCVQNVDQNTKKIEKAMEKTLNQVTVEVFSKCNIFDRYLIHRPSTFSKTDGIKRSWNIFTWSFSPPRIKTTADLYYRLLRRYLRLIALDYIIQHHETRIIE